MNARQWLETLKSPVIWILLAPAIFAVGLAAGAAFFIRNSTVRWMVVVLAVILHLVGTLLFAGLTGFGSFGMVGKKGLSRSSLLYLLTGLFLIALAIWTKW
jgi:hypothetical protein